jgi:hypothetical protein
LKTIDELLEEVREDKFQNLATTSFKFKTDVWEFFKALEGSDKWNCCEFGTHKGGTSRILSFLFEQVYTINLPGNFDEAQRLNSDRTNIQYIGMDLYRTPVEKNFTARPLNAFLIDAGHSTNQVLTDVTRATLMPLGLDDVYFVFDDYGLAPDVFIAIEQLIMFKKLEKVCYIGHKIGHNFGGNPNRILTKGSEGIICKLIR